MNRIGFMQGRLSPQIDGKIQAFPAAYWRDEFSVAAALGLTCMEWTIDHNSIAENPIMSAPGRAEILHLSHTHGIAIQSVAGDCFMQVPFWKATGEARTNLLQQFAGVAEASSALGAGILVVPLVDNGSPQNPQHWQSLADGMAALTPTLRALRLTAAFELDLPPEAAQKFIAQYPPDCFGINHDIGNSAALGWNCQTEILLLHPRIINVHVKDRLRGGGTVPLGEGAANLPQVFALLKRAGYAGNYILQTARAASDHAGALAKYQAVTAQLLAPA
jgi:hexulose-6-phosphate isomerase